MPDPQEVSFRPEQVTPGEVSFAPHTITPNAATPPPAKPSIWQQAWGAAKPGIANAFPGASLVEPALEVARHPIRHLPIITGLLGAGLGGPGGAALGAAGGEAWRQNYESAKSQVTGRPPEQPSGPIAAMAPPTTTPGGAALSIGREALTSGLLPEVGGRVVGKALTGALKPPPGSADAAVAQTSKKFGLGLTPGEISTTTAGRTLKGVEQTVGSAGFGGRGIAKTQRAAGEANAAKVLGGQLDEVAGKTTARDAGEAVQASAKEAHANLLEDHNAVQHQRELAHGRQEAARRAVHTTNQQQALAAHQQTQAEAKPVWDAAEQAKAAQVRAQGQSTFDAALKAKQASGQNMEAVAKQVTTPVSNAPVKAEAQRLIQTELKPQAEAYPLTAPETAEALRTKSGAPVAFDKLHPDAQAYLHEQAAATGTEAPNAIDPLDYANAKVRAHLTRVANAPETADFGAGWKYYSQLLGDSKFLRALKSPGEGQLSALAKAHRGALEEAASGSGVDWSTTSAEHAAAADTAREAAKGLSKRYAPREFKPAKFKSEPYTPEPFTPDKFTPDAYLNRLLTEEPSQLLDSFTKNGQVVPERIAAARQTLLKTAAGKPAGGPGGAGAPPAADADLAARNAGHQAEQEAAGVKPGTRGHAFKYIDEARRRAATPPPGPGTQGAVGTAGAEGAGEPEIPAALGPAARSGASPVPAGVWDTRSASAPPGVAATPPPGAAGTAGAKTAPTPAAARGQQAWDKLRTTLVRDHLLSGDMPGLADRLQKFGPDGLKELYPDRPDIPQNLQKIGDAFGRRERLPSPWLRILPQLVGVAGRGAAAATGHAPSIGGLAAGAATSAGLEGVPAFVSWVSHSPTWTKALTEGVTQQDTSAGMAAVSRVIAAWKASGGKPEGGPAATPPPGPR